MLLAIVTKKENIEVVRQDGKQDQPNVISMMRSDIFSNNVLTQGVKMWPLQGHREDCFDIEMLT